MKKYYLGFPCAALIGAILLTHFKFPYADLKWDFVTGGLMGVVLFGNMLYFRLIYIENSDSDDELLLTETDIEKYKSKLNQLDKIKSNAWNITLCAFFVFVWVINIHELFFGYFAKYVLAPNHSLLHSETISQYLKYGFYVLMPCTFFGVFGMIFMIVESDFSPIACFVGAELIILGCTILTALIFSLIVISATFIYFLFRPLYQNMSTNWKVKRLLRDSLNA